jgi:protein tyrosine/serine phosphatase
MLRSSTRQSQVTCCLAQLVALCLMTSYAVAQSVPASDPKHTHPAAGTSIVRFGKIDEGVYKGSKPKSDADFRFLQSKNVKTIVDLQFVPVLYRFEKEKAEKYEIRVIPIPMNASPVAPSERHVTRALCLLSDKKLRPVYFHCDLGRDRTSLIATLYEIYFRGLAPKDAVQEMKHFGFKDEWILRGLKKYLLQHADSQFTADSKCR